MKINEILKLIGDKEFLDKKLKSLKGTSNVIDIQIEAGITQYLYYENPNYK